MDFVLWLVLGAVAGILAVVAMYRTIPTKLREWVGALGIGLLGGWLGGWVANIIGLEAVNWLGSLVVAFADALLVLFLFRSIAPGK